MVEIGTLLRPLFNKFLDIFKAKGVSLKGSTLKTSMRKICFSLDSVQGGGALPNSLNLNSCLSNFQEWGGGCGDRRPYLLSNFYTRVWTFSRKKGGAAKS